MISVEPGSLERFGLEVRRNDRGVQMGSVVPLVAKTITGTTGIEFVDRFSCHG